MTGQKLDRLNTLGVPSTADSVHTVRSTAELIALAPLARSEGLIVLGGGSNVVLAPRLEQPVCLIRNRGIRVSAQHGGVAVTVAAGERWHDLVRWSLARDLAGLENLALIPGSVGAAPVQNIGAYGVEIGGLVQQVEALELASGRLIKLSGDECGFAYRDSLFKREPGRMVIIELTLLLGSPDYTPVTGYSDVALELERMGATRPRPQAVAEAVIRVRRRKLPDPRFVPNAGSFFKNPVVDRATYSELVSAHGQLQSYPAGSDIKLAAAQLIERCGFKTDGDGPVRVWHRQPLVLTNPDRRPADEVLAYAERIRAAVAATFGVRLEFEPDRFGC